MTHVRRIAVAVVLAFGVLYEPASAQLRTMWQGLVSLTAGVTGILPTANGGTGIAYFTAAGPTVARVYTFPDSAATVLTSAAPVTAAQGGTGVANNAASTITISGNFGTTFTVSGTTSLTLPTSGTLLTTTGSVAGLTGAASLTTMSLSAQPHAGAFNSAAQSVNDSTQTALTLDSEQYDVGALHSTVSNTSRMTIGAGQDGYYHIVGKSEFAASAVGQRILSIYLNGTAISRTRYPLNSATVVSTFEVSTMVPLVATDYIELFAYQDSGGALNVGNADAIVASRLMVERKY